MKASNLVEQLDQLVRDHLAQVRAEATAALERAFEGSRAPKKMASAPKRRASGKRRSRSEVAELAERLYASVASEPGEVMTHYAGRLGSSVRELNLPMTMLRRDGRLRTTGARNHMRYYPSSRR